MSEKILKRGDPVTLLATGEHTTAMVAGKNSFTVRGHVSAMWIGDEGRLWARGHVQKEAVQP